MNEKTNPKEILLKDYQPAAFLIPHIQLKIELFEGETLVTSLLQLQPNPKANPTSQNSLFLNGEELEFISAELNDIALSPTQFEIQKTGFTLLNPPQKPFTLKIKNKIHPEKNTALEGLYQSGAMYCTQNEPEGFRRITYFIDRPDVMSRYETTVEADKKKYPYLLSNGNPVARKDLENGRHSVTWNDPFPKPSYLFAMVAGDLGRIEDFFTTRSGRKILLEIYCDPGNESKCHHAMESLKKSMRWDEEVFGLEYDLDIYMIVAVDAFNMGAMENKGLNIFNSRFVLASPESATDIEFQMIEGVVAHEYFHNWTGNRVTCRDWFQLTLKEGLTVFRDQEFSADMTSRSYKRIDEVQNLRSRQFQEDSSPLSHPIRPEKYIEINNFYTATVYEKGSEVIRMIHTLIGKEAFRKGIDQYFKLYDGQAVTTEDFIHAMHLASGYDFTQFTRWYHQSGTPELKVKFSYDPTLKELTLECEQNCPDSLQQKNKKPFVLPLAIGILDQNGKDVIQSTTHPYFKNSALLEMTEKTQKFTFQNIPNFKTMSINRGFTAPIKLSLNYSEEDLCFLFAHDSDPFNRMEAGQRLAISHIQKFTQSTTEKNAWKLTPEISNAYLQVLSDSTQDDYYKSAALSIPSPSYFANFYSPLPIDPLIQAHDYFLKTLSQSLKEELSQTYLERQKNKKDQDLSFQEAGKRALKNLCLSRLLAIDPQWENQAFEQFKNSKNMSDQLAAMNAICLQGTSKMEEVLDAFFQRWKEDKLVLNKWFSAQAISRHPNTLSHVKKLMSHPSFDIKLPNNIYALLSVFGSNFYHFHEASGSGYAFIADCILELDAINPTTAARVASLFNCINYLDEGRKLKIKPLLEKILAKKDLTRATYELVSKFSVA